VRIRQRLEDITSGVLTGHRREDISADLPYLFFNEHPFVIVYDRRTQVIVRIVHGRRNLSPLLEDAADQSR